MNRKQANQLRGKINQYAKDKAFEYGVVTVEINPHGTSQYCSRCGARGRGSLSLAANASRRNGESCLHVRYVAIKPMPIRTHQKLCITPFTTSGIGNRARNRRRLQSSYRAKNGAHALSGHIPDGRSPLEGHPNEGGPGRFVENT